jgi:hypothetical protein
LIKSVVTEKGKKVRRMRLWQEEMSKKVLLAAPLSNRYLYLIMNF